MIVHIQEIDQVQLAAILTEAHIALIEITKEAQISIGNLSTTQVVQVVDQDLQIDIQELIGVRLEIEIDRGIVTIMERERQMELRTSEMWRKSHRLRLRLR